MTKLNANLKPQTGIGKQRNWTEITVLLSNWMNEEEKERESEKKREKNSRNSTQQLNVLHHIMCHSMDSRPFRDQYVQRYPFLRINLLQPHSFFPFVCVWVQFVPFVLLPHRYDCSDHIALCSVQTTTKTQYIVKSITPNKYDMCNVRQIKLTPLKFVLPPSPLSFEYDAIEPHETDLTSEFQTCT